MQLAQAIPAVWVYTTAGAFNALRPAGYGAFLTDEQKARVERVRQARLLFEGKHREYFLDERRTQFDFPPVRAGDRVVPLYLTHNVLGLISLKAADLLFGEEPLIRADADVQQAAIAALAERCNLHALLYGCAVDASYEGECFLEACARGGRVYLKQLPADEVFPVGELGPDGQYAEYVAYRVANKGTADAPVWLLLETRWLAGSIERRLRQLDDDGRPAREVDLTEWPQPAGADPLPPVQPTGVAANTLTWVPNLLLRGRPVSDYDGAIELQDALNAKNSQVARVLLKHSDPKLAMTPESAGPDGNVRADMEVYFVRSKEDVPTYIRWDAELESAQKDRAFILNQLLVRTETSPVLLGLKEGGAPDAYKKVRLESFNSLTKAARKAAYWKAGIRRAVSVALDLENTLPGVRYDRAPVAVELRDGIPVDEKDQAERQAILVGAGIMSKRRALQEQLKDEAAVDKELAELDAAAKQDLPTSLLAEPTVPAGDDVAAPVGGGDNQTDAVAGNDLRSTVGALNGVRELQASYYEGKIPREAVIANAMTLLGFTQPEAEDLFPEVAPDAPGDDASTQPEPAAPNLKLSGVPA